MPAGVGVTRPALRSNSLTPSLRSTAATCWEMPDWVAFSRIAARVKEPSSQTAMTARTWPQGDITHATTTLKNLMAKP